MHTVFLDRLSLCFLLFRSIIIIVICFFSLCAFCAMSLCLYSLNVRGMLKRKAIFLYLKRFRADFYFLQENHTLWTEFKLLEKSLGGDLWLSYGSSNSVGVAILKGKFKGKILKTNIHSFGRWVILVLGLDGNIFILGNVYGHNNKTDNQSLLQNFKEEISRMLVVFPSDELILGGDWNTINDPLLDCLPPRRVGQHYFSDIENLCLHFNCCDEWRKRNPSQFKFTWSSKDGFKQSRIDFWLVSEELRTKVKEIDMIPSILTDHKFIFVKICFNVLSERPFKFNYWKLNNSLLDNGQFTKKIESYKAVATKEYGQHWEFMKYKVRKFAVTFGKELAKARRTKEESIIRHIILICEKHDLSQIDKDKLAKLQSDLDQIFKTKPKGHL